MGKESILEIFKCSNVIKPNLENHMRKMKIPLTDFIRISLKTTFSVPRDERGRASRRFSADPTREAVTYNWPVGKKKRIIECLSFKNL